MVMGDDSCSRGHGFESWCSILDGHFFTLNCSKNCIVCLKRNEKEAEVGTFKKKKSKDSKEMLMSLIIWPLLEWIKIIFVSLIVFLQKFLVLIIKEHFRQQTTKYRRTLTEDFGYFKIFFLT